PLNASLLFTRGIRFEVAQDVLGAVIAHWAEAAAQARDAANPDAGHLAAIQAEQRKLRTLRMTSTPAVRNRRARASGPEALCSCVSPAAHLLLGANPFSLLLTTTVKYEASSPFLEAGNTQKIYLFNFLKFSQHPQN
ncbi:MAG: hypothetical protein LWW92_16130, partial [Rhodocyclales bacterium]|nr:hypothetical protein [Rhodocyclales bacterium]